MSLNILRSPRLPNAGPLLNVIKVAVLGSVVVYAAANSLYNVEGGHWAIVFNRIEGIRDKPLVLVVMSVSLHNRQLEEYGAFEAALDHYYFKSVLQYMEEAEIEAAYDAYDKCELQAGEVVSDYLDEREASLPGDDQFDLTVGDSAQ